MKLDPKTKLSDITVGDFIELQNQIKNEKFNQPKQNSNFIYGLKGLAKLLGCSRATASKIKNSGKIDDSYWQEGNIIVFEKSKVLELLGK